MSSVRCTRCGTTAPALERAPLPGDAGQLVLDHTCTGCWQLWLGAQVKLINEHKLSPARADHFDFLVQEMKRFLAL